MEVGSAIWPNLRLNFLDQRGCVVESIATRFGTKAANLVSASAAKFDAVRS